MLQRSLDHIIQFGNQSTKTAVPLATALLNLSHPKINVVEILSRMCYDTDIDVSFSAIMGLGLVGFGTNNARIATMLRNLAQY